MATAKIWKLGKRWAGITARGVRFVVPTKAQALSKIGKAVNKRAVKTVRSRSVASRRVKRTGKGKLLGTLSGVGMVEDLAWGFIGFSLLGKTPAALPLTRVVQGIQGHAFDRRGKARMLFGVLDLIDIWLAGGFGAGASRSSSAGILAPGGVLRNLAKLRPL